jgi:hypothetical protein
VFGHVITSIGSGAEDRARHRRSCKYFARQRVWCLPTAAIRERERATGEHVAILALTAYAMKDDADRCLNAGMDGYTSKPVHPEELFSAIERVLANSARLSQRLFA